MRLCHIQSLLAHVLEVDYNRLDDCLYLLTLQHLILYHEVLLQKLLLLFFV